MGNTHCDCSDRDCSITAEKLETVLTVLAGRYRRHLLYCVTEHDNPVVDFDAVLEYLIEFNPKIGREERDRLKVKLHHTTLPMLKDAGLIEHDTRSETIRYRGDPDIEKYLSILAAHECS